jgi:hypothetical protein
MAMRPIAFPEDEVLQPFRQHKVLRMEKIMDLCGCSAMTARRALRAHGYLTSYNFNAGYYTLAEIPEFDDDGLWAYRNIRFSRHGTLPRTLRQLVSDSSSGMSSAELEKRLKVNPRPRLTQLIHQGEVAREKLRGTFVYFSTDAVRQRDQLAQRCDEQTDALVRMSLPAPDRIIAVLVERILRPEIGVEQLVRRLSRRGLKMRPKEIEAIFTHYKLTEKKSPRAVRSAR